MLGGGGQRDGQSSAVAPVCGGCCVTFWLIFLFTFLSALQPNEYGLRVSYVNGKIWDDVQRAGIHATGPFSGFVKFPAAQLVLEFTKQSADRAPISSRTGADPQDPDSGGQPIQISCAVQFKFKKEKLRQVYLNFGSYYAARQRYLLLSGNMVSNTAQDFIPNDFWTRRDVIAATMLKKINETFWNQGMVEATKFQILRVDFAQSFEDSITAIQVAEQAKVVNEYTQQVQEVVQSIEVMRSENNAAIANISATAGAEGKRACATARRDVFATKQKMKATRYAEFRKSVDFSSEQMREFLKIHTVQSSGRIVVGLPGFTGPPSPSSQ